MSKSIEDLVLHWIAELDVTSHMMRQSFDNGEFKTKSDFYNYFHQELDEFKRGIERDQSAGI